MHKSLMKALKYDSDVINNIKKLKSLLLDFAPKRKAEINLLILTVNAGVAQDIQIYCNQKVDTYTKDRWIRILTNDWAINKQKAIWSIECWSYALGVNLPQSIISSSQNTQNKEYSENIVTLKNSSKNHTQQSPFETNEEYKTRLLSYPYVKIGEYLLQARNYHLQDQRFEVKVNNAHYHMIINRENAKKLFEKQRVGNVYEKYEVINNRLQKSLFIVQDKYAFRLKLGSGLKGIEPNFIQVPKGSYKMGSNEDSDEQPIHTVTIHYDFYIAKYQVTFEEYDIFCEDTKREKPNDQGWGRGKRPVINISWYDARSYCEWLSQKTGKKFRLPTEAEWEYTCKAGTSTKYGFSNNENDLELYGWYNENSSQQTHFTGEKKPNNWGLYDMHGNVWEWCEDGYEVNYTNASKDGSANINTGAVEKILRGGSWLNDDWGARSSIRFAVNANLKFNYIGFRIVLDGNC